MIPVEAEFGPWRTRTVAEVLAALVPPDLPRIPVIAVDGRSASGKTTLSARLAEEALDAAVVHTDDVAWHHGFFDWADLLRQGVLGPVRAGQLPVSYRPPAWRARGRDGAIEVPASCRLLLVEGVGVGRRELSPLFDALVWVQSDAAEARRRGIERDGGGHAEVAFWDEWDREELAFLAADRSWERADVVVAGTPVRPHGRGELVVADTTVRPSPR